MKTIFDFNEYKQYLKWKEQELTVRGFRQKLAQTMSCQPSYISQVLNGEQHLTLEQAANCHEFLGHNPQESHFFMLLLQKAKAGNSNLEHYFTKQIEQIREERTFLQGRIGQKLRLSEKDQLNYYSSHLNLLIHMAITIEELQAPDKIAQRLGVSLEIVRECLEFLTACKLAVFENGKYKVGPSRIHLGRDSKLVAKQHANWRVKALENLDLATDKDLHYSAVLTLSRTDWITLRGIIVKALEEVQTVVKDSPSEEIFVLNTDLFLLKK